MVWFHMVIRKIPLIMSAPPAAASAASPHHRPGARPNATMAAPQAQAASTIARPCRRTWPVQPALRLTTAAPTAGAAYSMPSTAGPPTLIAQALAQAAQARPDLVSGGRRRSQARKCDQRDQAACRIAEIGGRQAASGNEPAAEQRAGNLRAAAEQPGERGRGGQVVSAH